MLQELRSMIVGGALIHKNREGSKHEGQRICPTIGDFGGNCANNQSPFNNGRIKEWEEEKKEDRVSTTKIFRLKILINNLKYFVLLMIAIYYWEDLGDVRLMANMMLNEIYAFSHGKEGRLLCNTQLLKLKIKIEEKIVKAEVVDEHIVQIQDLQSYKEHDEKISTLLFGTRNKVGALKTCEEIMGFNDEKMSWTDRWEYGRRVKKYEGFRVDVKRKSIEDKTEYRTRQWQLWRLHQRILNQNEGDEDDGSTPEEQHLVVPCSDEEFVKFPAQPATTEIIRDNGPNIIKEDFSNDLNGQHSTDENVYELHFVDVNKGKHSRMSSSKGMENDEDMIQELTEECMDQLEHVKSKGAVKK
ncbi:hypothetical protein Tco_0079263 [Tanacetum coccineum]